MWSSHLVGLKYLDTPAKPGALGVVGGKEIPHRCGTLPGSSQGSVVSAAHDLMES